MTEPSPECQRALETYLAEEPVPDETRRHLAECPRCDTLAGEMTRDGERLRRYLSATDVPAPPVLKLRGPLHSASGHPRRISLTVIPLLLALLLLVSMLVVAMTLWILRTQESGRAEPGTGIEREEGDASVPSPKSLDRRGTPVREH